jgi:4-amino-4-deoxy-L-arabinose transferase-like glycosyltransferase
VPTSRPSIALLFVLAISAAPLLPGLAERDVARIMENISMLSSQETFLRLRGSDQIPADPDAWLMPTACGRPRLNKPPMMVWLNLLAFSDLTPADSTPEQLTHRARLVSVALALMLVGATFWIGLMLGGSELALTAGAVVGSIWFLQRQARTASYDIHLAAWATLAVAAGLAAVRSRPAPLSAPFASPAPTAVADRRSAPGRFVWGMLACLALACAVLSKGPLAFALVLPPLLLLAPRRWKVILAVALGGAALAAPWYLWVADRYADALRDMAVEFQAERDVNQPPWYYLGLLGLVLPWTPWLLAGLVFPWLRRDSELRPAAWAGWCWFIFLFVAFSIPGAKQQRYILPIVPAVALLVGVVTVDHARLFRLHGAAPGEIWFRAPMLLAMWIGSVALPAWIALHTPDATLALWLAWIAAAAGMLLVCWRATPMSRADASTPPDSPPLPLRFFIAAVVWMSLAGVLVWWHYDRRPEPDHIFKPAAQKVLAVVSGQPMARLTLDSDQPDPWFDLEEFHFHLRRITPEVKWSDLPAWRGYLVVWIDAGADARLEQQGWKSVLEFEPESGKRYRLWSRAG